MAFCRRLVFITDHSFCISVKASYFSTNSILRTAPSPSVSRLKRRRKQSHHPTTPFIQPIPKNLTWPITVLQSAEKLGTLRIPTSVAVSILDDVQSLDQVSGQDLCSKYDIKPSDLTLLAKALLPAASVDLHPIIRRLLTSACRLNDPLATFIVVKIDLKNKKLGPLSEPRQQLNRLVAQKNRAAMCLQGLIYEGEGKESRALEMFERSLITLDDPASEIEDTDFTYGDAWRGIYRMKFKSDQEGAKAAIEKAALEHDDPEAYYLLAKHFVPKNSQKYELYMLKAAASGEAEAADALGLFYFKQSQGGGTNEGKPLSPDIASKKRILAREWFNVGAEHNNPSSQVHLAILLRETGKSDLGLDWLRKASLSREWAQAVAWLMREWESETVNFMQLDMNKLPTRDNDLQRI